ncbi:HEAT repeat-containing protein [Catalinimonas alkaloidigena]|uniref:HEAT repeat-containing protein n=1 Tax=Catalinimonas alkaloidigena TaxID=1075417 RepID=A0A1G9ILE4_9BACT|nr:HEAT repeat domain-containing protein [Catalinimonas alkaloidigena]SDL25895.1 HEAT repeat-containing protein [Catalinimonas alkaloidigena]
MKTPEIETLVEKYEAGETTLEEEKLLADYFTYEEVPEHLRVYAAQFRFFAARQDDTFPLRHTPQLLEAIDAETDRTRIRRMLWEVGIAASLVGLLLGSLVSWWWTDQYHEAATQTQVSALHEEMKDMKQLMMLSLLDNPSASERIKAVSYADALPPDPKVVDALVRTLNHDGNPNVRLTAAEALGRFSQSEAVRQALIHSLPQQTEPIVQIAVINVLVDLEEKRARPSLELLLDDQQTMDVVKRVARQGLTMLQQS